jgi:lysyl-tRNA synthetase class 2
MRRTLLLVVALPVLLALSGGGAGGDADAPDAPPSAGPAAPAPRSTAAPSPLPDRVVGAPPVGEGDPLEASAGELAACLRERGTDVPATLDGDRDGLLDLAMATHVAPGFAADRVTFVHDFPASQAALARVRGPVASRFEAFWGGLELANGFHELNDAAEQSRRFATDIAGRARRARPRHEPDRHFLAALAAGLPDCAGVALGFDRVAMIAAGASRIDEVIAYPAERA